MILGRNTAGHDLWLKQNGQSGEKCPIREGRIEPVMDRA